MRGVATLACAWRRGPNNIMSTSASRNSCLNGFNTAERRGFRQFALRFAAGAADDSVERELAPALGSASTLAVPLRARPAAATGFAGSATSAPDAMGTSSAAVFATDGDGAWATSFDAGAASTDRRGAFRDAEPSRPDDEAAEAASRRLRLLALCRGDDGEAALRRGGWLLACFFPRAAVVVGGSSTATVGGRRRRSRRRAPTMSMSLSDEIEDSTEAGDLCWASVAVAKRRGGDSAAVEDTAEGTGAALPELREAVGRSTTELPGLPFFDLPLRRCSFASRAASRRSTAAAAAARVACSSAA